MGHSSNLVQYPVPVIRCDFMTPYLKKKTEILIMSFHMLTLLIGILLIDLPQVDFRKNTGLRVEIGQNVMSLNR